MNPVEPNEASQRPVPEQPETAVTILWQRWRQERCPDFSDPAAGGLSAEQALAVLRYDQCQRWRAGERVPAERYLHTYSVLKTDPDQAFVLIYGEFLLRQELGETPTLDEYLQRFPDWADWLRQQDEFHKAVEGISWLDSSATALPEQAGISQPSHLSALPQGDGKGVRAGQDGAADSATSLVPSGVASPSLEAPTIAGYEILGVLGRGAMGVVYQARDVRLKRLVALKMVLAGAHSSRRDRDRFRIEAEAVARLQHPNIVQIYDVGEQQGQPYCALEYLEGGTLAARTKDTSLPAPEAARVLEILARAMHAAHLKGIIHRDLKPGNVLLAGGRALPPSECMPKIVDFGLAKLLDNDSFQTRTGSVMGTPSYMAPEQAAGRNKEVGPAADIYSLGAMLYDQLTGRPPFKADTALNTLQQVLTREPVAPTWLNPKVPRELETICLKCLDKEPARRYGSADELADDLRRFLDGEPIKARPLGAWGRGVKWAKRRPALAAMTALACAAVVAALGLGGGMWYNAEQRAAAVKTLGEAQELLDRKHKEIEHIELRGKESAWRYQYVSDMLAARAAWETNNLGRLRQLLKDYQPGPDRQDVRGFEWFYFWRLAHAERLTLAEQGGPIKCVAVSPNGKLIASGSADKSVFLWDAATGDPKHKLLGASSRAIAGVAFSPDGAALAVASAHGVDMWDLATHKSQALALYAPPETITFMVFAPSGATLAAATPLGTVKIWDVKTRKQTRTIPAHKTAILTMVFSHDGKTLATGSSDSRVRLWELTPLSQPSPPGGEGRVREEARAELQGPIVGVTALAFSSNGASLATASHDGTVYVWEAATGKRRAGPFYPRQGDIKALAFTADDKALITGGTDQTVRVSDAATGQKQLLFKGHERAITCLALADQGKTLVTGSQDNTVRVWDVAGTRQETVLPRRPTEALCMAWSPDGRTLACGRKKSGAGGSIGLVELWDPAKKTSVAWDGHDDSVTGVAFSPSGAALATASLDHKVLIWDVAKGQVRFKLQAYDAPVGCLTFSRDGKWLASADVNGHIILWDPPAGRVKRLQDYPLGVRCLAFSPDGATLAASHADGKVLLWDVDAGTVRGRWNAHDKGVYGLSFSPDGATLATGSDDRTAKLWDWKAQAQLASFTDHETVVRSLAFAPDGRTLVTAAESVRLWDVATRLERAVLRPDTHRALCVAFNPDGRRLAAGTSNGPLIVWEGATDEELQAARPK
jgi:WD40 repeat protein